jgi:hypothetical protein
VLKSMFLVTLILVSASFAVAQSDKPIKIRIVFDDKDSNSSAVVPLLIQKFSAQAKLFNMVNDDTRSVAIVADCYRESSSDPYSCYYIATKWLELNQALLGGGIVVKKSAEETATSLFQSILQDFVERWNTTDRRMLITELETCLALTESSCAVPNPLVAELKAKSINLSQYMRTGGLKP